MVTTCINTVLYMYITINDYLKRIFTKHILVALCNIIIQTHILHTSDNTIKINNRFNGPFKPVFYTNHTGFSSVTLSTLCLQYNY